MAGFYIPTHALTLSQWIIPRNTFIDTIISAQPFGQEMPLSFVWEWFIRTFHYRDLKDLSPKGLGIYEGTPVVNNAFLDHIRAGKIEYIRGDTERFVQNGVRVNTRTRDQPKGAKDAKPETIEGDVVVLATGFERPTLDFLPKDVFPDGYSRPDLYLQNFATEDWTVLCTNSAYMNAIGTVGHMYVAHAHPNGEVLLMQSALDTSASTRVSCCSSFSTPARALKFAT